MGQICHFPEKKEFLCMLRKGKINKLKNNKNFWFGSKSFLISVIPIMSYLNHNPHFWTRPNEITERQQAQWEQQFAFNWSVLVNTMPVPAAVPAINNKGPQIMRPEKWQKCLKWLKWQSVNLCRPQKLQLFSHCISCPPELLTQPRRHCCHFSFSRCQGCTPCW